MYSFFGNTSLFDIFTHTFLLKRFIIRVGERNSDSRCTLISSRIRNPRIKEKSLFCMIIFFLTFKRNINLINIFLYFAVIQKVVQENYKWNHYIPYHVFSNTRPGFIFFFFQSLRLFLVLGYLFSCRTPYVERYVLIDKEKKENLCFFL